MTAILAAERTLPHSLEAERSVLGCLLIEPLRLADIGDQLDAADFYRDAHRRIFEAMVKLGERGGRFDFVTLKEELGKRGVLDEVGGPAYVASLASGTPRGVNLTHYAAIVREKAVLRDLIFAANKVLTDAYEASEDSAATLESAERAIYDVGARRGSASESVTMGQLVNRTFAALEQMHEAGCGVTGVATGLDDLDNRTRGMQRHQLVVVAARPGLGKSAFATCVARNVSQASTVLMFSLEMSSEEVGVRLVVSEARVNGHELQRGQVAEGGWGRVSAGLETLAPSHLIVDDTPHRSVTQVRSIVRRTKAQRGRPDLSLVIIDYLGLMVPERRRGEDKRTLEIADITRGLKLLAKELRVPILLLCQLNREPELRAKKQRPKLSDLAESGAIERDADQVWFLHRPDDDEALMEIVVAKNRSGPKGVVRVAYFEEQFRFANLSHAEAS